MNEDPQFLYPDTPDRKDIVVGDYTEIVKETEKVMKDYFFALPKANAET